MRFAGLENIFKIHLQLQLEACFGDVITTSSWQLEVKMKAQNIFETGKCIYVKLIKKFGRLVVFISDDSAEIWGVRYGLTLAIGTLKNYGQLRCFCACSL